MSTKPRLTLKRPFNATPEKIFSAWTDPEKIAQWWGPGEINTIHAEADPRVGGQFNVIMRSVSGDEHNVSGAYHEVIPNEKLVFTWAWRSTPERESLVTVIFKPDGAGTALTLTHEQFFDEEARDAHKSGWSGSLDKLERYCGQLAQKIASA